MNKKPKIAILTIRNTYSYGGVFSVLKIAYEFCEQYFTPTVFFLGFDKEISASLRSLKFTSTTRSLTYFGMNCIEIGARWAFWEPGHYAFTLSAWEKALEGYDYFLVVSATPIAAHPLIQLKKKFTLWMSTSFLQDRTERIKELSNVAYLASKITTPLMNSIEKSILEHASFIWAMSCYSKNQCEAILQKKRQNLIICGYPIDIKKIQTTDQVKNEHVIVAVGRFSDPRKNITLLLHIFDQLYQKLSKIKLYVIGQPPAPEKIAPFVSRESFENIIFTQQVSPTDLKRFYNKATLMLITSYQEGFGIAGLEALAHGIPIVSTDCGGIKDFVIDQVTGFVVNIADEEQMVEKALMILTNQELQHKMSQAAKTVVEENFSREKVYAKLKYGLATVYPELAAWFDTCDHLSTFKSLPKKHYEHINH